MLHPTHEAVAVPGSQSTVYTPFLVAVALFGKTLGVTPFAAMQGAGIFNVVLFAVGAGYLFSRASIHRHWGLPAACFIFTTLCLRWLHFGWSSEASLVSLQYLQCYPSIFAWALAFFAFGLLDDLREHPRPLALAALGAIVAVLLLTHVLTASWVAGIIGLCGVCTAIRRRSLIPLALAAAPLVFAVLLAVLWPYTSFFGQSSLMEVREPSAFGGPPWVEFPNLYALALPCFVYLWVRLGRHGFWLLGLLATLGVLLAWRLMGFTFGNRYALFAPFFAQFVVAEVMALGIFALLGPLSELPSSRRHPSWDRPIAVGVLLIACTVWLPSPMFARAWQKEDWGALWSPAAIMRRPSRQDAYYARFAELVPVISGEDRVIFPTNMQGAYDLAAITGAQLVSAPNAHRVERRAERVTDVLRFFDRQAPAAARVATVQKWSASKIVVPRSHFSIMADLEASFGKPIYKSRAFVVLAGDGAKPPPPAAQTDVH
jgi:hypothetical protein